MERNTSISRVFYYFQKKNKLNAEIISLFSHFSFINQKTNQLLSKKYLKIKSKIIKFM